MAEGDWTHDLDFDIKLEDPPPGPTIKLMWYEGERKHFILITTYMYVCMYVCMYFLDYIDIPVALKESHNI
jgi:hypothetical protein